MSPHRLVILVQGGQSRGRRDKPPHVTSHSIVRQADGAALEHCIFSAENYRNPAAPEEDLVRRVMGAFGAVVLIPSRAFRSGETYRVTLSSNAKNYAWSFSVD